MNSRPETIELKSDVLLKLEKECVSLIFLAVPDQSIHAIPLAAFPDNNQLLRNFLTKETPFTLELWTYLQMCHATVPALAPLIEKIAKAKEFQLSHNDPIQAEPNEDADHSPGLTITIEDGPSAEDVTAAHLKKMHQALWHTETKGEEIKEEKQNLSLELLADDIVLSIQTTFNSKHGEVSLTLKRQEDVFLFECLSTNGSYTTELDLGQQNYLINLIAHGTLKKIRYELASWGDEGLHMARIIQHTLFSPNDGTPTHQMRQLAKHLEENPENMPARLRLACFLRSCNTEMKTEMALKAVETGIEIDPSNIQARLFFEVWQLEKTPQLFYPHFLEAIGHILLQNRKIQTPSGLISFNSDYIPNIDKIILEMVGQYFLETMHTRHQFPAHLTHMLSYEYYRFENASGRKKCDPFQPASSGYCVSGKQFENAFTARSYISAKDVQKVFSFYRVDCLILAFALAHLDPKYRTLLDKMHVAPDTLSIKEFFDALYTYQMPPHYNPSLFSPASSESKQSIDYCKMAMSAILDFEKKNNPIFRKHFSLLSTYENTPLEEICLVELLALSKILGKIEASSFRIDTSKYKCINAIDAFIRSKDPKLPERIEKQQTLDEKLAAGTDPFDAAFARLKK